MSHMPLDAGTFAVIEASRTENVLVLAQIWPCNQAATGRGNGPSGISSLIPLGSLGSLGLLGKVSGRVCVGVVIVRSPGRVAEQWLGPIKRPIKARHRWPGQAGPYVDDEVYVSGVASEGEGARATYSRVLLAFQVRGPGDFQEMELFSS